MAGWALLLDYVFLPMINYLVIGIYLNAAFEAIPAWVWVVGAIALVTGLNVLGIRMVSRMNVVLIGIQVVFVVVFLAGALRAIAGEPMPSITEPFFGDGTDLSMILGGAAILCLSFLGFDAVSTLSEETHDPRRRVPRAIMLTTLAQRRLLHRHLLRRPPGLP
ncbi:APC family permease [Nonomuraea ferruginea]